MTEPFVGEIVAALQQGTPAEAERLCRPQLAQFPDDENLLLLLSISLQQQDRSAEAADGYARLTQLFPRSATHWTNYASVLRLTGKLPEAADAAATAIRLAPDDATHYVTLGLVQLQQNEHAAAQETLLKACALAPDSPEAHIHAAGALISVRDAQAYLLLRPWRSWLPIGLPELQVYLAHLLMTIGNAGDAYDVLVELSRRMPMYLPARLQLAALHERKNQLQSAESLLADSAALYPAMEPAARLEMAHLRGKLALRRGDLAQARTILDDAGPRTQNDYAHHFVLAEILDKLGDTTAAMQSLAIAHAWQVKELTPIAPAHFAPDAPIMPNAIGRLSIADYHAWPHLTTPQSAQSPVFIVGFPRSGTTLLEQMLDAHPALQSMDEQPFFTILGNELAEHGLSLPRDIGRLNQRDCDELRKRYVGLVAEKIQRKWDARLVDKNPLNMLWLPLIKRLFPQAKIILALRHPCDVVLSNYMQNYRSSVLASACSTLERTATAYVAAMESWLYHVDVIQPDRLISRYEELVEDPARQAQRIATFLELDDATPMLQFDRHAREKGFIATPSYAQVIQPVNRKGMDRWRRYQREFEPVLPILEPMLKHWGYATTGDT
jgi:Flp pilus assembly protein TadD